MEGGWISKFPSWEVDSIDILSRSTMVVVIIQIVEKIVQNASRRLLVFNSGATDNPKNF